MCIYIYTHMYLPLSLYIYVYTYIYIYMLTVAGGAAPARRAAERRGHELPGSPKSRHDVCYVHDAMMVLYCVYYVQYYDCARL